MTRFELIALDLENARLHLERLKVLHNATAGIRPTPDEVIQMQAYLVSASRKLATYARRQRRLMPRNERAPSREKARLALTL